MSEATALKPTYHKAFTPELIGELVQVTLTESEGHKTAPRSATWVGTLEAYAYSETGVTFALRGRTNNVDIPEGSASIKIVSYSRPQQVLKSNIDLDAEALNRLGKMVRDRVAKDDIWNGPTA